MLTEPERDHLFMLGLGRPPEVRYRPVDGVTPRLQRVLAVLTVSPAIIKTATWDVIAWNHAAAVLLMDYATLSREQRNILRLMFGNPGVRARQEDWQSVARFVVGAFRADAARAGANVGSPIRVSRGRRDSKSTPRAPSRRSSSRSGTSRRSRLR